MKISRRHVASILGGAGAGVATAFLLAIVLAVMDIYLSGHGRPTLAREWIDIPEWGISLSRADVILLAGVLIAALVTVILTAARPRSKKDA